MIQSAHVLGAWPHFNIAPQFALKAVKKNRMKYTHMFYYNYSTKQFLSSYIFRLRVIAVIREPHYYRDIIRISHLGIGWLCLCSMMMFVMCSRNLLEPKNCFMQLPEIKLVCGRQSHGICITINL
jgi:hypothetical protein